MKTLLMSAAAAIGLIASGASSPVQAQAVPLMGSVQMFAGNFCPRGWVAADGRLLPIAQYTAMFSLYGTIYGGDGRTTFGIPNLNGRVTIGHGTGPGLPTYPIGARSGTETTTMSQTTMPSHIHSYQVKSSSSQADSPTPQNSLLASGLTYSTSGAADATMSGNAVLVPSVGGSVPFTNMQPYLAQYHCVALEGTYPSRS